MRAASGAPTETAFRRLIKYEGSRSRRSSRPGCSSSHSPRPPRSAVLRRSRSSGHRPPSWTSTRPRTASKIVLANATGPPLSVLPGEAERELRACRATSRPGPEPRSFAVADIDNDGANDLAVAGGGRDHDLLRRRWDARPGETVPSAPAVSSVTAADLDSDGNYDIVAASATRSTVISSSHGTGDGTFTGRSSTPPATRHAAIFAADLDGDEFPDVAAGGNASHVLFGIGDGTFGLHRPRPISRRRSSRSPVTTSMATAMSTSSPRAGRTRSFVLAQRRRRSLSSLRHYAVGGTPVAVGVAIPTMRTEISTSSPPTEAPTTSRSSTGRRRHLRPQTRIKVGRQARRPARDDLDGDGLERPRDSKPALGQAVTVLLNGADAPQPVVCLVPRVARRKLVVARRLVGSAHCKVDSVRRRYSGRVRRGTRDRDSARLAGTRRPDRTPVSLLVSRGKAKAVASRPSMAFIVNEQVEEYAAEHTSHRRRALRAARRGDARRRRQRRR